MGTVAYLPAPLGNLPACLRELAQRIEDGEIQATHVVVCIAEPEEVNYAAYGPEPFPRWQAVGLLGAATALILGP